MSTNIGEYIVGAYLKIILDCDVVDYNVRPPGGGLNGLSELDVIGLNFKSDKAYLCEVTTHILGLNYSGIDNTIKRVKAKHNAQRRYADTQLSNKFNEFEYMFWSPVVPKGRLSKGLQDIGEMNIIINGEYKSRVKELERKSSEFSHDVGNPFFRVLQILHRLRD